MRGIMSNSPTSGQLGEWSRLIEHMAGEVMVLDADFHILLANQHLRQQFPQGIPEKTTCHALLLGRDRPCSEAGVDCPLREAERLGCAVEHKQLRLLEDCQRGMQVTISPLFDEAGRPCAFLSQSFSNKCEDVEGRERELYLRSLIQLAGGLGSPFMLVDRQGYIRHLNPEGRRLFGLEPDELMPETRLTDCLVDDDKSIMETLLARIKPGDKFSDLSLQLISPDGGVENLRISGAVCPDKDGGPIAVISVVESPRTRELQRGMLLRDSVLKETHDLVAIENTQGLVEYVNEAFCRATGHKASEITGTFVRSLRGRENDPRKMREMEQSLLSGKSWKGDYALQKADGHDLVCEASIVPVTLPDGVYQVALMNDLSRERELQGRLAHSQKMEAVGTLAGGIAHDFNNILQAILGYSELLLTEAERAGCNSEELREINRAGRRAADLIAHLMAFSRQGPSLKAELQLQSLVKEVAKLLRGFIPPSIAVDVELSGVVRPIFADATQMHQILMNLCTNAYHAMRDSGGRLVIRLAEVSVEEGGLQGVETGSCARIDVIDTGHGMDASTLEHIFDPYFTTKKQGEGTGLGLAVVLGVVESHDGRIEVSSTPGEGTCFTLYLPCIEGARRSVSEDGKRPALPLGRERLLLVDDEPSILSVLERLLARLGYEVKTAGTAEKALEELDNWRPALVLSDLIMPGMSGLELARKLEEERPEIRVMLSTGYSQYAKIEDMIACGVRDLLDKPYDPSELAHRVRRVLDDDYRMSS
jgi:two-component system cell cycle sensor histidine kinase/response regulator CckA